MDRARWHRIDELFHAALARPEGDRVAFLDEACADDTELRREIESLLAQPHAELATGAAMGAAAQLMTAARSDSTMVGRLLGPYEIVTVIGEGGMGVVYRAFDQRLRRVVAVKVLPRESERDPDRLRRFSNEARAASALNHPHILTVYDIGEADGAPFIAMEFIDGITLRARLGDGAVPLGEALDVAVQIALALGLAALRPEMSGDYYRATGELDKEIDAYRLGVRNYPRDWGFHTQLSVAYIDKGQYEDGLKEGLEAARLQANVEPPYRRQLDAYIFLDRLPEAKQLAEKLRAQGLDGARIHQRFLEMAYVEDDQAAISREIQWFAGTPEEFLSFGLQAATRNVHGQRRESHKLYQRAAETALRLGLRDAASEFDEADARADALSGNCRTARRLGRSALALAMCGDAAQAEKLAAETSKLFPNGTIWNAVQLPEIRAAIALKRDQPAESVELLASASPYERSYLEASYLRGLAYQRLQKGAEATAEFKKIVDHKCANWGSAWLHPYWAQFYSLSYLGMARGFALAGDTAKAKKAFQDFFELWKDADPDIPILQQAKAQYAKLQ